MKCAIAILCATLAFAADIKVIPGGETVEIQSGGKPLTTLYFGRKWDKPFLYPLRTPNGVLLSRGWPVLERPGDSKDHVWHRGLFFGHGDINGVDFWRELGAGKTGKLIVNTPPSWRNKTLTLEADMRTPDDRKLGSIRAEYRFSEERGAFTIDTRVSFRADAGVGLKLGDTEEAAFAVRLAEEFREDRGATLMNSDGLTGTKQIWGKRARWVDYSSKIDGQKIGLTIFDHPANPAAPTYWHARGYGLNSANAFGVRDFTGDKTKDGGVSIPPGQALTFRYLVVVHDGDAAAAGLAARFDAFAKR